MGPIGPPIKGAPSVRAVFTGFFPTIKGININWHIVDGEWWATVFDFNTAFDIVPMVDCFHVVDGQIMSIRVCYDPRPILEGMSRAGPPVWHATMPTGIACSIVLLREHHLGYIDWATFQANQTRIDSNVHPDPTTPEVR